MKSTTEPQQNTPFNDKHANALKTIARFTGLSIERITEGFNIRKKPQPDSAQENEIIDDAA